MESWGAGGGEEVDEGLEVVEGVAMLGAPRPTWGTAGWRSLHITYSVLIGIGIEVVTLVWSVNQPAPSS